jgi:hypothetical protein
MKMMSMKANIEDVDSIRKLLAEHDAAVFRVIELKEGTPNTGIQVIQYQILFYVRSDDAETFLKLKFPANTFQSVDA